MEDQAKPLALIILDGYGLREETEGNAVALAKTPNLDSLKQQYPYTSLGASGQHVGLPDGQMGNSEVGHLNMGAGRIVYQDLTRISKAIETGEFFSNPALLQAINHAQQHGTKIHLIGLLSDGGVHSHNQHLYALLELMKQQAFADVYIHGFLDGRDTEPDSAKRYIAQLQEKIAEIGTGHLATVQGRYYAMDRDQRWDRVQKAYRAMVYGEGAQEEIGSVLPNIQNSYDSEVYDEFITPIVVVDGQQPVGAIQSGDAVIFFNFRPDRAIQITRAFTEKDFPQIERGSDPPQVHFVCMTEYSETIAADVAFQPTDLCNTLGEVLQTHQLLQLRIAETEKFKHVTSFFSGGREQPFDQETRILIDSPKVATYDLQPEMSAPEVTDAVCAQIAAKAFDVIILNFANPDMVGHTGKLSAAIAAVETVDHCVGRVVQAIAEQDGIVLLTADHGNADMMQYPDGSMYTAHTVNRVPFIITRHTWNGNDIVLREDGILADIAPTILKLLSIEQPKEMTGKSLIL